VTRRSFAIVALLYAGLIAALFWRVWLRGLMSGWDCIAVYWPDLAFQIHALRDAEWPSWNPHVLGGYPYWADPQTGRYHPVNWLCWLLGAVGGDGPWLVQAKVWIHLLAGICGMHAWGYARTRSHAAAAVAALTLAVGGPTLVVKNSAILWPIMYAPWALWALERLVASPTPRRGAALAVAVWLVAVAGSPPGTFYVALALAGYAVFLSLSSPTPRHVMRVVVRAWSAMAVCAVLAALLLFATYLPAAGIVADSYRAERGPAYVLQQPLLPSELRDVIAPNLGGDWMHDLYLGAFPVAGALWLVASRRGRARAEAAAWIGLGLLAILLALGRRGHLLPWLAAHVPGFGLFRIAYRYKLLWGIAAAVLAGDALGAVAREHGSVRTRWAWAASAAGFLGAAGAAGATRAAWLFAAATLAAATGAVWLAGRRRASALLIALVPAVALAELWHAGAGKLAILEKRPDPAPHLAAARRMEGTALLAGPGGTWRYHVGNPSASGGAVPYFVAVLAGRRELSGYPNPIRSQRYVDLGERARRSPAILRHFNARYFPGHRRLPAIADDVAPLARWYGTVERLGAPALLDRLEKMPPSGLHAALVESADIRGIDLPHSPGPPVDGRLLGLGRDDVTVEIDAPAAGVVVINEAFAPGWTARVGGREARVFRAQYLLRAVLVQKGRSRVELRYRPRGHLALPALFVLGLLLAILLLAAPGRGRWAWLEAVPPRTWSQPGGGAG
jgi:hypothetical protein